MTSDSIEWFDANGRIARQAARLLGLPHIPVKELAQDELPFITAHLIALEPEDRRLRFGQHVGDAAIAKYCATIDFEKDGVFGIYDEELQLRAFCHLAVIEHPTIKVGELGLSIHADFRGHGIGTLLFDRGTIHARNAGIERIFVHCLMENRAMRHIAEKGGMTLELSDGEVDAHLRLRPSNPGTVLREAVHEQLAVLDFLFKQQIARVKNWTDELLPGGLPADAGPAADHSDDASKLPPIG